MVKTIYILRHPESGSIRYVGATVTPLSQRLSVHIAMAHKNTSKCAAWIRSLLARGLKPLIAGVHTTMYWQEAERETILQYRALGYRLLNMTAGGLGVLGCKPSSATRAKRSATLKARYANDPVQMAARQELMRNAARSPAARAAASARMRAVWADPKRAADMRVRMTGVPKTKRSATC